jgi:ribosomal protein S18 acetylase RimI-like enzyme
LPFQGDGRAEQNGSLHGPSNFTNGATGCAGVNSWDLEGRNTPLRTVGDLWRARFPRIRAGTLRRPLLGRPETTELIAAPSLPDPVIALVPMTEDELLSFVERSVPSYAEDHVKGGRWKPEDAVERSRAEHARLLPQGVRTPDTYLRTIRESPSGRRVGETWYTLQRLEGWPQMFVYWIGIDPEHRRKGFATEVFRQIESEARTLGAAQVALHVFGENTGARALYEKLGYRITNVIMAKPVQR